MANFAGQKKTRAHTCVIIVNKIQLVPHACHYWYPNGHGILLTLIATIATKTHHISQEQNDPTKH